MRHDPTLVRPPEVIDLPRLRLRRPRPLDAGAIFEFASDREAARYADWPVSTDISSVMQLLRGRDQAWNDGSEFYWVITLPAEEKVIGAIACSVSGHVAEFGYLLNRSFWFNGYATEAARAVVQWASSLPEVWRVAATCDIDNVASARVLEKVGLTLEAVLRRAIVRPNISSEPRDALLYAKVRE